MDTSIRYAGFWRRTIAALIDYIIVYTFIFALIFLVVYLCNLSLNDAKFNALLEGHMGIFDAWCFIMTIGSWFYWILFWSSSKQATLGMHALGLKMVNYDYKRISFKHSLGRYCAEFFSGLTLGIGYFMIAFTKRRQGLHDMIAKTYVIKA